VCGGQARGAAAAPASSAPGPPQEAALPRAGEPDQMKSLCQQPPASDTRALLYACGPAPELVSRADNIHILVCIFISGSTQI
jgi:hypothetical protein